MTKAVTAILQMFCRVLLNFEPASIGSDKGDNNMLDIDTAAAWSGSFPTVGGAIYNKYYDLSFDGYIRWGSKRQDGETVTLTTTILVRAPRHAIVSSWRRTQEGL